MARSERILMFVDDVKQVGEILNSIEDLIDDSETRWSWLKSDGSNKVMGTAEIGVDALVFETNSVERSEKGIAFLQSFLSTDLIGAPISVHDNIEHTVASALSTPPADAIDLSQHPELLGKMQDMMKGHYLKNA